MEPNSRGVASDAVSMPGTGSQMATDSISCGIRGNYSLRRRGERGSGACGFLRRSFFEYGLSGSGFSGCSFSFRLKILPASYCSPRIKSRNLAKSEIPIDRGGRGEGIHRDRVVPKSEIGIRNFNPLRQKKARAPEG